MRSNLMKILTSDAIHGNESDMVRFVFTFKERVKIGQENWFRRSFLEVFRLHPLTPFVLHPNFYQMKGVIEIHCSGKFHHYSISGCQVLNF